MSQRGFRQCFFVLCKSRKDIQVVFINMGLNTNKQGNLQYKAGRFSGLKIRF
jgi:hypothetical protein